MMTTRTRPQVALIPCPSYAGSCDFSSLLTAYFSKPRFTLKHDIFGVSSLLDFSFNNQVDDPLKMNQYPTIYFKVTSMDGSGFWMRKDRTALSSTFIRSQLRSAFPRKVPRIKLRSETLCTKLRIGQLHIIGGYRETISSNGRSLSVLSSSFPDHQDQERAHLSRRLRVTGTQTCSR